MSEIVFILGAGASRMSGAPLMYDFLEKAEKLARSRTLGENAAHFDRILETISDLQIIHSKSEMDISNIETLFALLEMARTIGGYKHKTVSEIDEAIKSLKILIQVTLEKTIKYTRPAVNMIKPAGDYEGFANLIHEKFGDDLDQFSIITYNYDVALDVALKFRGYGINYHLTESDRANTVTLLKLHGSLNWFDCTGCNQIVPLENYTHFKSEVPLGMPPNTDVRTLEISSSESRYLVHCAPTLNSHAPIIVPPTWNKTVYHSQIANVWIKAAKELSNTEHIFVIGYSLPESDYFFKYLYALGTIGDNTIKSFNVYNPDKEKEINYRSMISKFTAQKFNYHEMNFNKAIGQIEADIRRIRSL